MISIPCEINTHSFKNYITRTILITKYLTQKCLHICCKIIISLILCSLVKPLPLGSSSILKKNTAFVQQLKKWLGEKRKWNLCYRASRDGWKGSDFHNHCDDKGPTVVLIKANGYIFGGYTDQDWGGMRSS